MAKIIFLIKISQLIPIFKQHVVENLPFVAVIFTIKKGTTKIQNFGLARKKIVRQQLLPLIIWLSNRAAKLLTKQIRTSWP